MLLKSRLLTTLLFVVAEALPSQEHISNDLSSISHESSVTWTGRIEEDGEVMSFTGLVCLPGPFISETLCRCILLNPARIKQNFYAKW